MTQILDTPLTRLKADCESKLVAKDILISELLMRVESANEKVARVKGANDMLRLLLSDMMAEVQVIRSRVDAMAANISELKNKLPEIE